MSVFPGVRDGVKVVLAFLRSRSSGQGLGEGLRGRRAQPKVTGVSRWIPGGNDTWGAYVGVLAGYSETCGGV